MMSELDVQNTRYKYGKEQTECQNEAEKEWIFDERSAIHGYFFR